MKKSIYVALGAVVLVVSVVYGSQPQQIAPPILKEPFGRPRYLTILQTSNASTLLKTISDHTAMR